MDSLPWKKKARQTQDNLEKRHQTWPGLPYDRVDSGRGRSSWERPQDLGAFSTSGSRCIDARCYLMMMMMTTYRFVVIEGKVKGQFFWSTGVKLVKMIQFYWRKSQRSIFWSTGVKQVKMIQFCWQWSQNVHLVNTVKNENCLPEMRCLVTMVTQQKRPANGH